MKNRRFRILTLLFAIIMMFSTTSVYAQESATVRAVSRTISKDTVYSGTLAAGETHTYYFTPSYTGLFTVETFGTTDTYGTMSGNSVTTFPATASNDDGGEGTNFAIGFRQEAGNSTTITVRHFNSSSGTGSYTIQVRDQRAQIYTFDYGSGDIDTTGDSETPYTWLNAVDYAVGIHENKPASHLNATIASTFKRINSEVIFFAGHGNAGSLVFMNSSGNKEWLYDTSSYFSSMSNTKVAVWASCYSGVDPDGTGSRKSIAQKSIDIGAQSAIGWNDTIGNGAAKKWTDQFFINLGHTMTVEDAAAHAGTIFVWPWDGSYDGWQVYGDGSTVVSYPTINSKSGISNVQLQTVDSALLQSLSDTDNYTPYTLKGLGTRYYKTINGCLTNEFYDVYSDGTLVSPTVTFSENDILSIDQQTIVTNNYTPVAAITANNSPFGTLVKSEEHIVYMKFNGSVVPIKIIYSDYQNDDGLKYQDVVCINLLDNTFIDYADICTK